MAPAPPLGEQLPLILVVVVVVVATVLVSATREMVALAALDMQ
jgi:hypothetical protein